MKARGIAHLTRSKTGGRGSTPSGIAMSQQQQAQPVPPEPNVAADHQSLRKSSCASTDVPVETTGIQASVEATAAQRFLVDEITQQTPCDLQTAIKNLMFTGVYGTAMPTQPGDVYHGQCWRSLSTPFIPYLSLIMA